MSENEIREKLVQGERSRRRKIVRRGIVAFLVLGFLAVAFWPRRPLTHAELLLAALDARSPETWVEGWLREIGLRRFGHDLRSDLITRQIIERNSDKAIPVLIGVIDADDSYESVYKIGHHSLRELTGVEFSFFHDGAWWRRWWSENRERYSKGVRDIPIPDLPKTRSGKKWKPFAADIDTLKGKLRIAPELVTEWRQSRKGLGMPRIPEAFYASDVAEHRDPHAIPYLIALLGIGGQETQQIARSLRRLTGVEMSSDQTEAWWRQWWIDHRREFADDVAAIEAPDLSVPWKLDWTERLGVLPDRRIQRRRPNQNRESN